MSCINTIWKQMQQIESLYTLKELIKICHFINRQLGQNHSTVWQSYCTAENTWELPSNIPNSMLQEFESSLVQSKTGDLGQTRREGLQQHRENASKEGFILNIQLRVAWFYFDQRTDIFFMQLNNLNNYIDLSQIIGKQ